MPTGLDDTVGLISGSVDEEFLLRNAYLVAENRILRDQIQGRLHLSDAERQTLAEIGRSWISRRWKKLPMPPSRPPSGNGIAGWGRQIRWL